jgi:lipopolysaccharide export system protein LptA
VFKKILLFVTTLAVAVVAFMAYTWRETARPAKVENVESTPHRPARALSTKPAEGLNAPGFELKGAVIPPGDSPKVVVLDSKGNAKIIFQSAAWRPISETGFHVTEPNARMLLPGGQLAYVWADEGEVELQRHEGNNFTPRKGLLRGNVRIFIDRSKPEWREANRDWVEPERHPEMIVKMWLDNVEFDLDLGRIESHGPITVQSPDGSLEGRGLELIWNETNRQVRLLRIEEGRRAIIRTSGLVGFGGGSVKDAMQGPADAPGAATEKPTEKQRAAKAAQKRRPATQPAKPKVDDRQFEFHTLDDKDTAKPPTDRIDAYNIEFKGNVVAEQKDGGKVAGQLKAAVLQLVAEIGREERAAVEHVPEARRGEGEESTQPAQAEGESDQSAPSAAGAPTQPKPERRATVEVRWTGELVATPIMGERSQPKKTKAAAQAAAAKPAQPANGEPAKKAEQFHVVATGSPVELFDRDSGGATCQRLEYHAENKRLWLTGTRDEMVTMNAGADRQLMGEKVFFDRQTGIARVEGAGRMVDQHRREGDKLPACMGVADAGLQADEPTANSDISWTGSMQIEFGLLTTQPAGLASADPAAGIDAAAGAAGQGQQKKMSSSLGYLRRAVFDGQVNVKQQDDLISADHVEALFLPPRPGAEPGKLDRSTAAESIIATGNVHMTRGLGSGAKRGSMKPGREKMSDAIACERLEVEMTIDDTGRNVPKIGRAFGKVDAMRVSGDMQREIHAADGLVLQMASVPRPITPEERARFEAGAARCGFAAGSPEWQAFEKRLQNRRKMVATNLLASRSVRVQMRNSRDPQKNMDLVAESLDCTLREDEDITRALIVGTVESPASVDLGDVYVKGPQISLDMDTQLLEVPGAGTMRFVSKQDLTGRAGDTAVPVVVSWDKRMSLRGKENVGTFAGGVSAASATTTLNTAELRIEFENLAAIEPTVAGQGGWVFRPLLNSVSKRSEKDDSPTARMGRQMRKRASYLRASGDAVIVSTQYAKPQGDLLTRVTDTVLPATVKTQMSKVSAAASRKTATQPADPRLIVSRFRVAGPLIGINLAEEHFDVQGPGNLLVEDRRLPQAARASAAPSGDESLLTSAMGPLDSAGPSQTLFQWQTGMSFVNKRNTAVFDKNVMMEHVSGAKMAYSQELAAAMNIDPQKLEHIRSRQAHLGCEHLLVEFDRRKGTTMAGGTPLSEVTQLKTFQADGKVLFELDGGQQSASGKTMTYSAVTGEVQIVGSPETPAQVMEQDERTGKLNLVRAERDNRLEWNQRTGTIHMTGANITATGR